MNNTNELMFSFIKLIVAVAIILYLIYILGKVSGNRIKALQKGKYIKVLESTPLTKDNAIMIVKIGDKNYVMSSGPKGTEILMEIEEDLSHLENVQNISFKDMKETFKFKKGKK